MLKNNEKFLLTFQICARHVQSLHEDADNYYRNVIQAFVKEALNLSQFLEKVVVDKQSQDLFSPNNVDRSSTSLQNIDTLDFNDWVSFLIDIKIHCTTAFYIFTEKLFYSLLRKL